MFNTQFLATASNLNGMTRPTSAAGTSHATIVTRRIAYVWSLGLCGHDNQPVEWLSCLQHPVHDDGQLTRHCNGGTLDTKTVSVNGGVKTGHGAEQKSATVAPA